MVSSILNPSPPSGQSNCKQKAKVQTVVSIEPAMQARGPLRVRAPLPWANGPTFTQLRALASVRSCASVGQTLRGRSSANLHASACLSVHCFSSCSASHCSSSSNRNSSSRSAARPCLEWPHPQRITHTTRRQHWLIAKDG